MLKNWYSVSYIDTWSPGGPLEIALTGDPDAWKPTPQAEVLQIRHLRRSTLREQGYHGPLPHIHDVMYSWRDKKKGLRAIELIIYVGGPGDGQVVGDDRTLPELFMDLLETQSKHAYAVYKRTEDIRGDCRVYQFDRIQPWEGYSPD